MRYPLNLVLQNWEYLWFYLTFWAVTADGDLKLPKLSIHTHVMLQKCVSFPAIFAMEKLK